jgi:protein phosphatase
VKLAFPALALVALVGPSGAGKSSFAARHFLRTEVLSSDFFRGLVADDENDQAATGAAFDALHHVAQRRLEGARLTVVDATNVRPEDRRPLVELARRNHVLPVAIVFDLPERLFLERNESRPDRVVGPDVVRNQHRLMRRSIRHLGREGFRYVFVLKSQEEVDDIEVERTRLRSDLRHLTGPFDIIGDVHGCCDELVELLSRLGYREQEHRGSDEPLVAWTHPEGRTAVFVGDLVNRGPRSIDTVLLARAMTLAGTGLCVPGNHDAKLVRKLKGGDVKLAHGLELTMAEFDALAPERRPGIEKHVGSFLDGLVTHLVLDGGRLVVAHAGLPQDMQGRASAAVRAFALYGETTGETDEAGRPIRYQWAVDYRGRSRVVYGHTPVPEVEWLNHTVNIDTGCAFGGKLTALRYPELELVSVAAARTYWRPRRPFLPVHTAEL